MLKKVLGGARRESAMFWSNLSARNVLWNVLSGAWTGILIVIVTPFYVARLGLEGYGIVGLWLVMQVMLGLLDMGMGATVIREFADSRRNLRELEFKRDLLRTLEIVYWALAGILSLTLVLAADWLVANWLKSAALPRPSIVAALQWMAVALGLQFPAALYSSGLAGLQAQGRMNALQFMGNSLRYGCGAAVLLWRADLAWFFAVQALVAVVQTFAVRGVLRAMISEAAARPPVFQMEMFKRLWRFSTGMALTSGSAVLLANADRLALSMMVSTEELGKYAVAYTATGLLQLAIQPFYRAYFPRYSELVLMGETRIKRLRDEYFQSCRLMAASIIPMGSISWVFAPYIFNAWLGNSDETTVEVFRWLLIGITCSGLVWLPAAMQQAHGWTRLHAGMIIGALVMGLPIMVWLIKVYGVVGASAIWVLHGVSDITLGLWLMHRRLLIGELQSWYRSVLLPPMLVSLTAVGASWWLMPNSLNNWLALCWIGVTGLGIMTLSLYFSLVKAREDFDPASTEIHSK